jgi:hypothetical protein
MYGKNGQKIVISVMKRTLNTVSLTSVEKDVTFVNVLFLAFIYEPDHILWQQIVT